MSEINGRGAGAAQGQDNQPRSLGSEGHPGKHLGQFKQVGMEAKPENLPLVLQQLDEMRGTGNDAAGGDKAERGKDDKGTVQQDEIIAQQMVADTQRSVVEQMNFSSRFNALATAF